MDHDKSMDIIYGILQTRLNTRLTQTQKQQILQTIKSIPVSVSHGYDQQTILKALINILAPMITTPQKQLQQLSIQEDFTSTTEGLNEYYQKNITEVDYEVPSYVDQLKQGDTSLSSILGVSSTYSIQRLLNPGSLLEKHYVCLDSKYRQNVDSKEVTYNTLSWAYAPTINQQNGFVVCPYEIRNIIAIRLYQLRIPWDNSDTASFPTMRSISILFHEFASQSIITHTQRKFHFLWPMLSQEHAATFQSYIMSGIELAPENEEDTTYKFQKPIISFDSLTYSLGDPYSLINLYHDRDTCTFTYGATTTITTTQPHYFTVNRVTWVTIIGFTTDAPITDTIMINNINSQYGLEVDATGASTLNIPYLNTSSITPTIGLTANIYFDRRRIFMHMEFTCLKN